MSTITWIGNAPAVAQVSTITVTGTWATGDTATITINGKTITFTVAATETIAAVVAGLIAAWNASTYPEVTEITASGTSPYIVLTADTAGKPFTITTSESTAGDGELSDPAATVANSGPNDLGIATNYSGGALPTNSDTLIFENSSISALYNLEALSAVTLALLQIKQNYTGQIGLPNIAGTRAANYYNEYRPKYLAIGATLCRIGEGDGTGSNRIKINFGSVQTTIGVYNCSSNAAEANIPQILLKGTHASNSLTVLKGTVGVAFFAGEVSTVATVNIGLISQTKDSKVYLGSGCTLTTITKTAGELTLEATATTFTQYAGDTTIRGSAALTTLTNYGNIIDQSSGTFTTVNNYGSYDHSKTFTAKTITTYNAFKGGKYSDPFGTNTLTNGIVMSGCNPSTHSIDIPYGKTLTIA